MQVRALRLARLYYFAYFGAIACYFPYINLYFQEKGLSGQAIGLLGALPPLIQLAAGPLWGALGDRFHIHRWLLPVATLVPIVPVLLMTRASGLAALAALVAWYALFAAPVTSLIDSAVLDLVAGTRHTYGNIRVWGSVGFTVLAWAVGNVVGWFGLSALFYCFAALLLVAGLLSLALPARRQTWQSSFRASLGQLLRQRALALFLAGSFLVGATLQASYIFYPLYLEQLGGDLVLVGLATALGALSEIPVMFFSGLLFQWLSVRGTVVLGYLAFAVRWAALALFRAPLPAVLTSALHGLTFGPFMAGGVAFVEAHTPPGLHATAQGLLVAVSFGLGAAAGALAGGWLFERLGPAGLFATSAAAALLAAGFVLLAGTQSQSQ